MADSTKTKRIRRRRLNRQENKARLQVTDVGAKFEYFMTAFMNEYMDSYGYSGIAYMHPEDPNITQKIDIIVDALDGDIFLGVECKSIHEEAHPNGKIPFEKLFHVNKNGLSQVERQHMYLKSSGRYGIIAFELRVMNEVFLVPHRFVLDKWQNDDKFITFEEIICNGYQLGKPGDLRKFIKNKCN